MSTPNDRDPAAPEPDPTGMRALLASLPDPGPMPVQVTERITASLQREHEHRLHHPGQEGMPSAAPQRAEPEVARPSTVSTLDSRRRTRVPHLLAAAASVAAVAIAGVVLLDQVAGNGSLGDMAAVYWNGNDTSGSAAQGGADSSGGRSIEDEASGNESGAGAGEGNARGEAVQDFGEEAAEGEPGDVRVITVTRPLTSDTFALGVSIALATAADDATGPEPELTAPAAASCLRSTGRSPAGHDWTLSAVAFDGDDAVLVVASGDPDQAWALTPDCAQGSEGSQILLGPVDVP